jgi:iron(III) transport system substrate-binding protein
MAKADSAGNIGLFVLSKFRDVDASIKGNLSVGAFQASSVEPFAGFMYPLYAQIAANGPRPYTAMLFINYLMTEEGFTPWGGPSTTIMGAYSSSSDIGASEGDQPISFWKGCLVAEDANYIMANKSSVVDFVNSAIAKK